MVTEVMAPVAVPVEPTTPIKRSEAIRLGCLIAPVQNFDGLYINGNSACAIGAMALGYEGGGDEDRAVVRANVLHGNLPHTARLCPEPACGGFPSLVHLNDDHRWTRERIADWLAEQGL